MIPLVGCQAHGGKLLRLDDESVVQDQGSDYEPFFVSTDVDADVGGSARLRRFNIHVDHDGDVTVTVTPYRDGNESGPAIVRVLATGDNPLVEAPMGAGGTRFAVKVSLSDFTAAVECGKAEMWIIPRRTSRR